MMANYTAEELRNMNPEELVEIILNLSAEKAELQSELDALQAKYDQQAIDMVNMARSYADLKVERDNLQKEKAQLEKDLQKQKETTAVYARMLFIHGTESVIGLPGAAEKMGDVETPAEKPSDAPGTPKDASPEQNPDGKDGDGKDKNGQPEEPAADPKDGNPGGSDKGSGKRGRTGPKENLIREAMKGLPQRNEYLLSPEDILKLDLQYGPGNWRIISWEVTSHVEIIPRFMYTQNDYRPVVEYRIDGISGLWRPECPFFFPHSIYSPSLVASIICDKFSMGLPIYRQMGAMDRLIGDSLDRGSVSRMIIRAAQGCFMPIYTELKEQLIRLPYSQCDETPVQVIEGGASLMHYMWCHTTGELRPDDPKIVLFDFEMTRCADHLRKYFSDGFIRTVTSDCYVCYLSVEKEEESLTISNCWTHCRRRFYMAYRILLDVEGVTEEMLEKTAEFKVLSIIGKMYDADTPLKHAAPEVRLEGRQTVILPLVNTFFDELKAIDLDDPTLTAKMREAVSYALNHEDHLRRFLDDPYIPIDNSECERNIRPFAVGRRNWLFSATFDGGDALAVCQSLISTALKNGADPFFYIKYVCERMPGGIDGPSGHLTEEFIRSMMVWSPEYRAYEEAERTNLYSMVSLDSGQKPDIAVVRAAAEKTAV